MPIAHGDMVKAFQAIKALPLERCPHCKVAQPYLAAEYSFETTAHDGQRRRLWSAFVCRTCGGAVVAGTTRFGNGTAEGQIEIYPSAGSVADTIPEKPRRLLEQAVSTLHAPDGAVMLAASAVDAMLKEKGLAEGSLYVRIDRACREGILTADMAAWAHQIRLDANDARHADVDAGPHTSESAGHAVEFARALAEILFVLPARVTRGIAATKEPLQKSGG